MLEPSEVMLELPEFKSLHAPEICADTLVPQWSDVDIDYRPLRVLVRIDVAGNVSIVDDLTIEEAKDVIARLVVALRECQEG